MQARNAGAVRNRPMVGLGLEPRRPARLYRHRRWRHAYRYDSLNRLRHLDVWGTAVPGGLGLSSVLQSYGYRLRVSGHRRELVKTGTTAATCAVNYAYDEL
jgi:hypothetical protein